METERSTSVVKTKPRELFEVYPHPQNNAYVEICWVIGGVRITFVRQRDGRVMKVTTTPLTATIKRPLFMAMHALACKHFNKARPA